MKHRIRIILFSLFAFFLFSFSVMGSELYPATNPADWSPGAIASWTKSYYQPKIASGEYVSEWYSALPPIASAAFGDLFIWDNFQVATMTTIWRCTNIDSVATWVTIGGFPTAAGITSHYDLTDKDFSVSGHTGFASSGAIPNNASFSHDLLDGSADSSIHDSRMDGRYIPFNCASDATFLEAAILKILGTFDASSATACYANRIEFTGDRSTSPGLYFDMALSDERFSIGSLGFGNMAEISGVDYYDETFPEISSGVVVLTPNKHFVLQKFSSTPWIERIYNAAITASAALYLRPLEVAPDDTWTESFSAGCIYVASPSHDIMINNGSSWVAVPKTGGLFEGTHSASDSTAGITEDVEIPFEYNVSTTTLHFKDGLYVGKN